MWKLRDHSEAPVMMRISSVSAAATEWEAGPCDWGWKHANAHPGCGAAPGDTYSIVPGTRMCTFPLLRYLRFPWFRRSRTWPATPQVPFGEVGSFGRRGRVMSLCSPATNPFEQCSLVYCDVPFYLHLPFILLSFHLLKDNKRACTAGTDPALETADCKLFGPRSP